MDPLDRADALLSRARARSAFVVTPDNAVSPMDAASTMQIPRSVVRQADNSADDTGPIPIVGQGHHLDDNTPTAELPTTAASTEPAAHNPGQEHQPHVEIEDVGGLIPTTTQRTKSELSRRLDG